MARQLAATADKLGAEVRLRPVGRVGEEASADGDSPGRPTADDSSGPTSFLFGSPTRFGNVAGQLKQFIDSLGAPGLG